MNATRGAVLADSSGKAATHVSRGIGLIGLQGLPPGGGLIIQPCSSVHSFFMRFAIDVLFVDSEGTIRHAIRGMAPWRTSKIVRSSKLVVELPPGTIDRTGTEIGDTIEIVAVQ